MNRPNELTARERIAAHALCREADELADKAPWSAWLLRPLERLIRWMDAELYKPEPLDY
jgi:hypothetical protein